MLRAALDARAAAAEGWTAARQQGDETGAILAGLGAEREIVAGALLQPLLVRGLLPRALKPSRRSASQRRCSPRNSAAWVNSAPARPGRRAAACRPARRMPCGGCCWRSVTDPRLVLVRLAEQLRRMRRARELDEAERLHLAWETREIYAPLANRLGIWQLKWELEDLSFRHLEPAEYRRIAGWLNESRIDRERYIDTVIAEISAELAQAGIRAEVVGRPKHIYSIWRKMHRKSLAFEQVFDVRAVRDHHGLAGGLLCGARRRAWPLALHPGRVRRLHRHAQGQPLPFVAHRRARARRPCRSRSRSAPAKCTTTPNSAWPRTGVTREARARDAAYDRKIEWLRELLAPASEAESDGDFLTRVRADLFDDRVYALTAEGRSRGPAGRFDPDRFRLSRAHGTRASLPRRARERPHRAAQPSSRERRGGRDHRRQAIAAEPRTGSSSVRGSWRHPGAVRRSRAWFKRQDMGENRREGREMFERELSRLGAEHSLTSDLIGEFNLPSADALHLAIGSGELSLAQVTGALERRLRGKAAPAVGADLPPIGQRRKEKSAARAGRGRRRPR